MSKNYNAAKTEQLHKDDSGYKSSGNLHFLLYLIGLAIAVFAVRAFIFEPIRVDGVSMLNTLQDGERCFAEKVSYWFAPPKQGDIVIVHYPGRGKTTFVKRVIAVAGQTVEIRQTEVKGDRGLYTVYVDGEPLDESAYASTLCFEPPVLSTVINYDGGVVTVPEGCVFVMGDHRTDSHDSRMQDVKSIALTDVIGRVRGVMWPKIRNVK